MSFNQTNGIDCSFGIQYGKNDKLINSVSNTQNGGGNGGGGGNFFANRNKGQDDSLFKTKNDLEVGTLFDILGEHKKSKVFSICF